MYTYKIVKKTTNRSKENKISSNRRSQHRNLKEIPLHKWFEPIVLFNWTFGHRWPVFDPGWADRGQDRKVARLDRRF